MSYTFKNTEINNEKASTFETKSLLYLIGMRKDSKEVEYITIDCFNDISGLCKNHKKVWDIQSKNHKTLSPGLIGESLFTLFDNYLSIFSFHEYILFTPQVNPDYLIDDQLKTFHLNNFKKETFARIKEGLRKKIEHSKGTNTDFSQEIEDFLQLAIIVQDDKTESDYIKKITKFKDKDLKSVEFYNSIFIELRSIQSDKKNSYIENSTIKEIKDVLNFNRYLKSKDIELLIINRIIGNEIFSYKGIPIDFLPIIHGQDKEDVKDILQECNSNLSKAFFNKNSNKLFWKICEHIISYIKNEGTNDVEHIYNALPILLNLNISYLNKITLFYLIAIILEGINDN